MFDKLEDLLIRYEEIMGELSSPGIADNQARFRKLMKEQSDLTPIVNAYKEYKECKETVADSLAPVRDNFNKYINDKAYLKECYTKGAEMALKISSRNVSKVYHKIGFVDNPLYK